MSGSADPNATEFEVVSLPNATIASGTNSTFVVAFQPQSAGPKVASIVIVSNDPDESTFSFDIEGTGVLAPGPEIQVWCSGQDMDASHAYSVGGSYISPSYVEATFSIENLGTPGFALSLSSASLSGPNAAMFSIRTQPSLVIPEGASTTMVVRYTPTVVSALHSATVTIPNNDGDEGTYTIALTAFVRVPEINVRQGATQLLDGSGSYAFGNIGTDGNGNTASANVTFTVENPGTGDLTITSITATGDTLHFDLTKGSLPRTVGAAGSTTFTAAFDPIASGDKSVIVSIVNNDADENPYTFTLTGKGVSANKMYWSGETAGVIFRANRDGSNVEGLVSAPGAPWGVALDMAGGKIYWTEWQYHRIMRADLDGSNVEPLMSVAGYADGLAIDPAGGYLYFANNGPRTVERAPIGGGSATVLASGMGGIFDLAIDAAHGLLYWPDCATSLIHMGSVGGGSGPLGLGPSLPNGIALDVAGGLIYLTSQGLYGVYSMPIGGGAYTRITSAGPYPIGIALDKANEMLYWVDRGTGTVMRSSTSPGSTPQTVFYGSPACAIALDIVP